MRRIVALTGGIGSGKSVVAKMLSVMGVPVYDCDRHAKRIMDNDQSIKAALMAEVTPEAVDSFGVVCRAAIARVVFADAERLAALNRIVHGAVRADLRRWLESHGNAPVVAFETAILRQGALSQMATEVWTVTAPEDVRLQRLTALRGMKPEDARARMVAQSPYPNPDATILNDNMTPLLPQIEDLLEG